jgi:tetratricopeptide (TPR) repeat protein
MPDREVFRVGEVAAGRWRIDALLGHGGTGEVYEAYDLELREAVALKTLGRDAGDEALERLKVELLRARRVTHPNVARLYDLGRHEGAVFLTRQLLRGESLARRLEREGRLAPALARDLAVQMAAGLCAAHRAGVAHGDFRSAHVRLVPREGTPWAVITDLGLAHPQDHAATPAGDVLAFGEVLSEMLGARPGARALPGLPALDKRWQALLDRCLEPDPERRLASGGELLATLEGFRQPTGRIAVAALAGGLALFAGGVLVHQREAVPAAAPVAPRRAVAVLGFKNLSSARDSAWLSTALGEMLATELAAGESLRLVPGAAVARMKSDLALPDSETLAPETLARVRQHLGADVVVLGSYVSVGGRLRLDVRLQDAIAGETVAAVAEEGAEDALFALVSRTGVRLRQDLGVRAAAGSGSALAAYPADPAVARLYAEGLTALRDFDPLLARTRLEAVVKADPDHPLAHSALSEVWALLGYDARASAAARRAFDLSAGLGREDRLLVEGRLREAARDWPRAVEVYRALWGFYPDDPDHGLRLAGALTASGRPAEAADLLDRLPSDDPRVDLARAEAAQARGEGAAEVRLARAAAEKGQQRGARLLEARARQVEAFGYQRLGDFERSLVAGAEVLRLQQALGNQVGVGWAHLSIATARYYKGDFDAALSAYESALSSFQEAGNTRGVANALTNMAIMRGDRGETGPARKLLEAGLQAFRETGNLRGVAVALGGLSNLARREGDLAAARRLAEEDREVARQVGNRWHLTIGLLAQAGVERQAGELARAAAFLGQARELATAQGADELLADVLQEAASQELLADDLPAARQHVERTLELRRRLGRRGQTADALLIRAELALASQDHAAALRDAAEAAREYRNEGRSDGEGWTELIASRVAAERGDRASAEEHAALAAAAAASDADMRLLATVQRALARADVGALPACEAARDEAARLGLVPVRLEAELAAASLARSPERLRALAAQARRSGHGLLAARADRAASAAP